MKASAATWSAQPRRSLIAGALVTLAMILVACAVRAAQVAALKSADSGRAPFFLVANPEMSDPVFEQTVILMLPPTEPALVAGIVINKPTKITLGQLFAHSTHIKNEAQTVYFGGPVDLKSPAALIRSAQATGGMSHLLDNVYLSSDKGSIREILQGAESDQEVRLFFGRAQWSVEQLHSELLQGAWTIAPATAEIVFSPEPAKLWRYLEQQAKMREVREDFSGPRQWFGFCALRIGVCGRGFY